MTLRTKRNETNKLVAHDIYQLRYERRSSSIQKAKMASTSKESNEKELVETSVNLFTEPHNRMKELVSWPLTEAAEFSDVHELEPSLQAIYEAMWELKTHEYIENHYIMDTLKQRLHSRRVRPSLSLSRHICFEYYTLHCSKSSFFVQKFNFDFPRKLSNCFG